MIPYQLKCRDKKILASHIESIDDTNLTLKPFYQKQAEKKAQEPTVVKLVIPSSITLLTLTSLTMIIRFCSQRKRKKQLKSILDDLFEKPESSDEETKPEEDNEGEQ